MPAHIWWWLLGPKERRGKYIPGDTGSVPPNPTLVYAFLLASVCDSVSLAEDIEIYWVVIMEYIMQVLMWGVMRKRGET